MPTSSTGHPLSYHLYVSLSNCFFTTWATSRLPLATWPFYAKQFSNNFAFSITCIITSLTVLSYVSEFIIFQGLHSVSLSVRNVETVQIQSYSGTSGTNDPSEKWWSIFCSSSFEVKELMDHMQAHLTPKQPQALHWTLLIFILRPLRASTVPFAALHPLNAHPLCSLHCYFLLQESNVWAHPSPRHAHLSFSLTSPGM